MNTFLREARKLVSSKLSERFCIIIGNESCDLDSAVCSLSLAYYYNRNKNKIPNSPKVAHVVPLFNIKREELPIKTEVIYFLRKNNIEFDSITFQDDINESFITNNDVVLVDHHFSRYSPIAVFDHRPFDPNSTIPKECKMELELVGSCATLIANIILSDENYADYKDILRLLHAAIVLDTVNFSKEAQRAKEKDFNVCERIESLLGLSNVDNYRKTLFDELVEARADVSSFDSYQILLKDMKLISSKKNESIKVALPGFPKLVKDYIALENAEENIKKFAKAHQCQVIVLIGMKVTDDGLKRDVGVINMGNDTLFDAIVSNLKSSNHSFDLEEYIDCKFLEGKYFNQKNIRASRKQILPLVKTILDEF
ncbi:unnamed protein product [Hermetia illucens]|uniref:DHHA2 domain-containing protein n=1 Tax=Hermetia illucens TaxID=343691 RepID=A0A7R8UTB1_HERIL|nr:exopolyphosphatase PRUNE1 [Hermetia illucens]CAD7086679.1 unnamed protein product [Hermetia illucens]